MNHREIFDSKLGEISSRTEKYFKEAESYCSGVDVAAISNLNEFKGIYQELDKHEQTLNSLQIDFNIDTIKMLIDVEFSSKLKGVESERNNLMLTLRNKIEKAMSDKRDGIRAVNEEIKKRNAVVRAEIDAANSRFQQLERKRKRLLEYSSDILQLCSDYGIKISDININNDMFTMEELDVFYEQFYSFISLHSQKNRNPISWLRDKVKDNSTILAGVGVATIFAAFSPILDILSIGLLLFILYSQAIQESLVKKYTIMAGLAFNINPLEFGMVKEIPDDMIEQEISEDIDVDNEPEFKELLEEVNTSMDNITDDDIRSDMSKAIAAYAQDYPQMQKELSDTVAVAEKRKNEVLSAVSIKRDEVKAKELELKSKVKLLGQEFSSSGILETVVKLGVNKDTLIYETLDVGMQNIIFKARGNDPRELDSFIKILLANYLCNVRPGFLDVTVYDPNGMGRSLAGFYNTELEQVFKISSQNLDEILKDFREHTDKVIRTTKGKNINEYNKEVSKEGRICLNYKLLVVLSQPKSIEENEALRKFIEYSADLGVFVWMISDLAYPNTKVFKYPFEGVTMPIQIDPYEFPVDVMNNMEKAFKDLKSPSLGWQEFKNKALPDEKIWTGCADEFIDLDPGFEDGDSSKFKGYTVGNVGDVHALCVGGTGSGKSVFINNLVANMCTKYSPKEIELWMIDFKGTEFAFYLKRPDLGSPYMLPHIRACLCTSDPDYSVSLFRAIRKEADDRYNYLKKTGFEDMYSHNMTMRKKGTPEKCMKRSIVIVDEFQVIFEKTDPKAQEELKAHITQISKVARACGVHLFFCSQSMKGTISDDILSQFNLRFALRCPMEVSTAVMGTKLAGDIREKNGYLYISSSDDKKKELQKRYRTPYIPKDELRERINLLAERCIKENISLDHNAVTYDEQDVHNISEVDEIYDKQLQSTDTRGLFILGERMVYSNKGRRKNIFLPRENNQHIYSTFMNIKDAVMFFKTIMTNLKHNGPSSMIFNTQVKDLGYVCGVDEYLNEDNIGFYDENQTPTTLLPVFQDILNARKQKEDPSTLKPLYIFCIGWDKAMGFGVDSNYRITDKYATMLQTCGTLNMHFIFITSSQGEIPKSIVTPCYHRVAGKCDEKSSTLLVDSNAAYKNYDQPDGYMFVYTDGISERLKIYQSEITRELKEKELIL